MAIVHIDPLDSILKKHDANDSVGEVFVLKQGLLSSLKLVLQRLRQPLAIPFDETPLMIGGLRLRLQGTVTGFEAGRQLTLAEKRFPKGGKVRGMEQLSIAITDWVVDEVTTHSAKLDPLCEQLNIVAAKIAMAEQGTSTAYFLAEQSALREQMEAKLKTISASVIARAKQDWALMITLTLTRVEPKLLHTQVTVPCPVKDWPKLVNITHYISLIEADPATAASAGELTEFKLREWAQRQLAVHTEAKFSSLTLNQIVSQFAARHHDAQRAEASIEDQIKTDISLVAKQQLGYAVHIYTATPELGIGELGNGFTVSMKKGEYHTRDFQEGTFPLNITFQVKLRNLRKAIDRRWLDASDPERKVVEYAAKDIEDHLKSVIQFAMNSISTFTLLSQTDGGGSGSTVERTLELAVEDEMERIFSASISGFQVLRPMRDKLSAFRASITRECHGAVNFVYQKGSLNEITFDAAYRVGLRNDESIFLNFFNLCFAQISNYGDATDAAGLVKKRIEAALHGYANQFLRAGPMQTHAGYEALIRANSAELIHSIFAEAGAAIEAEFGLDVILGPLTSSVPYAVQQQRENKRYLLDKTSDAIKAGADAQVLAINDVTSPEIRQEYIEKIGQSASALGDAEAAYEKAILNGGELPHLTAPPAKRS